MRVIFVLCAHLLIWFSAFGQDLESVKSMVSDLTDSTMAGRGYVQSGGDVASTYIAAKFDSLSVETIQGKRFQPFSFNVNTFPTSITCITQTDTLVQGRDFIVQAGSGTTKGYYRAVNLDSTHFQMALDTVLGGRDVAVIKMEGINSADEVAHLFDFQNHQLHIRPVVLVQPGKTTWSVSPRTSQYATVEIDGRSLTDTIADILIDVVSEEITYEARNVLGKIAGESSDSCFVFTAHYDHLGMMGDAIFPGASDNASGVATMLDLSGYYAKNKPCYDIYFIAFAGEEAGLVGSKYFVDHPLIELSQVSFLINVDLMGSAAKGITLVNGKLYPDRMKRLAEINEEIEGVPRIKLRGKAANSDHYWFSERGVPSVFIYTEGNAKAYHDVNDTPDGLDWANYDGMFTLITEFINTWPSCQN